MRNFLIFLIISSLYATITGNLFQTLKHEDQLEKLAPDQENGQNEEIVENQGVSPNENIDTDKKTDLFKKTDPNQDEEEETQMEKYKKLPLCRNGPKHVRILQRTNTEGSKKEVEEETNDVAEDQEEEEPNPCTCGVFLSSQIKKGSKKQPPKGLPVLMQEMDTPFMNNAVGNRQCTNKCLELVIKHLPKSHEIICSTVDRDVFKERVYLYVKNHSDKWHGTNLSAGREFCCKDNEPYKCPAN